MRKRLLTGVLSAAAALALVAGSVGASAEAANSRSLMATPSPSTSPSPSPSPTPGIQMIEHIVIIMQENRSFDHYFGVYESPSGEPVDGLPRNGKKFTTCIPHPVLGRCVRPYHADSFRQAGGPHGLHDSVRDVNGGKMDGFILSALASKNPKISKCANSPFKMSCDSKTGPAGQPDVMSYFTRKDIPNYWAYADWGVLQDHMFESADSYSLPAHLYLMSGWSASCTSDKPMSCASDNQVHGDGPFAWTDITYLLDKAGVSWAYYVGDGTGLDCPDLRCPPTDVKTATPAIWNPVPGFTTVRQNHSLSRVQHVSDFLTSLTDGTTPQVSWIIPGARTSEHPIHGSLKPGYSYVTNLVNAIGSSPEWTNTAIFVTWDDWGGFYDHVKPIRIDKLGYGIRVPGLVISPYAKAAYVDHQTLSFDAYLKFIEDRFLGGQRLDPRNDGRPDPRPTVRENATKLGDLVDDFDFTQPPRPAPILTP